MNNNITKSVPFPKSSTKTLYGGMNGSRISNNLIE